MRLTVTPLEGEPRHVRANAADKVAWERYARTNNLPLSPRVHHAGTERQEVDTSTFPVDTWHLHLAYSADTRGLEDRPDFYTWLDGIDSVESDKEDPGGLPDPTPPTRGPA